MPFENITYGIPLAPYILIFVSIFVPLVLIFCNPLIAGLVSGVLVVGCCELGEAYGWHIGGGALGLLFVFLWVLVVAVYIANYGGGITGWFANIGTFVAVVIDVFQGIINEKPTCVGVPVQGGCQVQAQQQYNPHEFPMQDPQDVILYHNQAQREIEAQLQREIEAQAQGMSRRNGRPVPINPSLNR